MENLGEKQGSQPANGQSEEYPVTQLTYQRVKPLKNSLQDYELNVKTRRLYCLSTTSAASEKSNIELVRDGRLVSRVDLSGELLRQIGIQNLYGISFGGQKKVFLAGDTSICILDLKSLTCHSRFKRPASLKHNQVSLILKTKMFTDRADRVRVGRCQQLLIFATATHLQIVNSNTQKVLRVQPLLNLAFQTTQVFLERRYQHLVLLINWAGAPKPLEKMKLLLFDIKTLKLTTLLDTQMSAISPDAAKLNRGFFLNALFHERKIFLSIDFFEAPSFLRPSIVEIDFHFESASSGNPPGGAVVDRITPRIVELANTFVDIVDYIEEEEILVLKDIESKRIHFSLTDGQVQKILTPI